VDCGGPDGRLLVSTVDAELEVAEVPAVARGLELTEAREARVGDVAVRRLLPLRLRRSVGAWCFVDHYGPMSVDGVAGMRVPPAITAAADGWREGWFGSVADYDGEPLPAPPLDAIRLRR
jgi:hypothetical protein